MIFYNCKWIVWLIGWTMPDGLIPYGWACFPFIFFRGPKEEVTESMMKHEKYHYRRQWMWLVIPYHIAYVILWVSHGYYQHPFEIAARKAENK